MFAIPRQCFFFQSLSARSALNEVSLNAGFISQIMRTRTERGCIVYSVYNKECVVEASSLVGSVLTHGVFVLRATRV